MPNKQVTIHIPSGVGSQEGFHQVNVSGEGVHPGLRGMVLGYDADGNNPWGGLMVRVFFEEPFSNTGYLVLFEEESDLDPLNDATHGIAKHTHWVDILVNTIPTSEDAHCVCIGD